jgi:hypothetical protein
VVEGIVGASDGKLDGAKVRRLLSAMKGRQFLLNSAHLDDPLLFETRWVMSYLKGPISQDDIKKLMAEKKTVRAAGTAVAAKPQLPRSLSALPEVSSLPPVVGQNIEQRYHLLSGISEAVHFEPWLAASASVRFSNAGRNIEVVREVRLRLFLDETWQRPDWRLAETTPYGLDDCRPDSPGGAGYSPLPPVIGRQKDFKDFARSFHDYLYQNSRLELNRVKGTNFESRPDESPGDFKVRFSDHLRSQKEQAVEMLHTKYQARQAGLAQKLNRAADRLSKEQVDVQAKTADSLVSFGVAVVGAFLGRKALSAANLGRAATGIRSVGRVVKEKSDVRRTEEEIGEIKAAMEDLAAEIEQKALELAVGFDPQRYEIETFAISPRRSDIFDLRMVLLWETVGGSGSSPVPPRD